MAPPTLKQLKWLIGECESSVTRCISEVNDPAEDPDDPQLSFLPADHVQAFKNMHINLRHTTTSLALAFKPPLTIAAANQQLEKFIIDLCHIPTCVCTAKDRVYDGILLDEWKEATIDLCNEAAKFLRALSELSSSSTAPKGNVDDPYLRYTAMIWECCDKVSTGVSGSEGQAVAKRWSVDTEIVKDAWTEFKESIAGMAITPVTKSGDVEEFDEDDMGGFGSSTISEEELKTVEFIKPLLQLLQILHAYLPRLIPSLDFSTPSRGRQFVKSSNDFTAAFDDLVCALYPTHNSTGIDHALEDMDEVVREMFALIRTSGVKKDGEAFLVKWEERMKGERIKWTERRLSLGGLADSLQ